MDGIARNTTGFDADLSRRRSCRSSAARSSLLAGLARHRDRSRAPPAAPASPASSSGMLDRIVPEPPAGSRRRCSASRSRCSDRRRVSRPTLRCATGCRAPRPTTTATTSPVATETSSSLERDDATTVVGDPRRPIAAAGRPPRPVRGSRRSRCRSVGRRRRGRLPVVDRGPAPRARRRRPGDRRGVACHLRARTATAIGDDPNLIFPGLQLAASPDRPIAARGALIPEDPCPPRSPSAPGPTP